MYYFSKLLTPYRHVCGYTLLWSFDILFYKEIVHYLQVTQLFLLDLPKGKVLYKIPSVCLSVCISVCL